MAEAGKFHLSLFEWTTPERLFVRLKSIFGDEDLAFDELSNAYYTNVRSARVSRGDFGHLLWEEAEINTPEFCRARPLMMWPDGFSIENEIPQRRRWAVFFSLADAHARWPSLRPAMASTPKTGAVIGKSPCRRPGRPPIKTPQVAQAMRDAIKQGELTLEGLQTMDEKTRVTRFGVSRETCRNALAIVLSEIVGNSISDNSATKNK